MIHFYFRYPAPFFQFIETRRCLTAMRAKNGAMAGAAVKRGESHRLGNAEHCVGDFETNHMSRYFGPLPPSRGVQRGPSTSVALQSIQFGGLTRSSFPTRS